MFCSLRGIFFSGKMNGLRDISRYTKLKTLRKGINMCIIRWDFGSSQHKLHCCDTFRAPPLHPTGNTSILLWLWQRRDFSTEIKVHFCVIFTGANSSPDRRLHLNKNFSVSFEVLRTSSCSLHFYFILFIFCTLLVAPIEHKPRARLLARLMNFTTSVASQAQGSLHFVVLSGLNKKKKRNLLVKPKF